MRRFKSRFKRRTKRPSKKNFRKGTRLKKYGSSRGGIRL